jgi:pyruvate formate lyase activating enzyme
MPDRLGLLKTTLLDYPGRVASTIFTHGCPYRCPYCHNANLVSGPIPDDFVSTDEVLAHLYKRRKVISGVCITGGEPLVHRDLIDLCRAIKEIGLDVKLDTNGAFPDRLGEVVSVGVIDYVAMDIKTAFSSYERVGGDGESAFESLRIIQESGIAHEFRTTVVPGIVDCDDLVSIADYLRPGDHYVIAQFRPGKTLDPRFAGVEPYPGDVIRSWRDSLCERGIDCDVRGVI